MDWRIMLTSFGVIFLAEIGDKTQIAAVILAAETKKPWSVLIATWLALAVGSAISVLIGTAFSHYVPIEWVKRAAAVVFIFLGVLILAGKF